MRFVEKGRGGVAIARASLFLSTAAPQLGSKFRDFDVHRLHPQERVMVGRHSGGCKLSAPSSCQKIRGEEKFGPM